jgi:type II secretion system protein G
MDRFYKMIKRNNKGFTLVELMVVLLILGILVAIAVPIYNTSQDKAKETACDANIRTLEGAAALYHAETGNWPKEDGEEDLSLLENEYIKEVPECPSGGTYDITENGTVTCSIHKDTEGGG